MAVELDMYANPVYGNGDYPDTLKQACANMAQKYNVPYPLLTFTDEEKALQKGIDFITLQQCISTVPYITYKIMGTWYIGTHTKRFQGQQISSD